MKNLDEVIEIIKKNSHRNYLRVLEVISSLNCELDFKSGIGRKQKMSDCVLLRDRSYLT